MSGLTSLLGMLLVPSGTTLARNHRNKCRERIERQEHKLPEVIRHHGMRSRQTTKEREELRERSEKCEVRRDRDHR